MHDPNATTSLNACIYKQESSESYVLMFILFVFLQVFAHGHLYQGMAQAFFQFGDAASRRRAHTKNEKQPGLVFLDEDLVNHAMPHTEQIHYRCVSSGCQREGEVVR